MKINRNNYEVFFIDFYDGKLTDAQQLEMEVFLKSNPDLKAEFAEFENITLEKTAVIYAPKQKLKKSEIIEVAGISEDNYEESFIAFHENDLNANEKANLLSFLEANPQLEKEFQLHGLLSMPNENIVFKEKEQLKKKIFIGYYWYGAAAAVLIFLALNLFLNQNKTTEAVNRHEIVRIEKAMISNAIVVHPSNQLIVQQKSVRIIELPVPESFEKEKMPVLASVGLQDQVLKQQVPVYLIDWAYTTEILPVVEARAPRKRGLLAQFFRKNVADVSENLGIDKALADNSVQKKKDPGFVKFLDGSLAVFNTVTGSDAELVKIYDNEGNLKNYSLEGQAFVVNRKLPAGKSTN